MREIAMTNHQRMKAEAERATELLEKVSERKREDERQRGLKINEVRQRERERESNHTEHKAKTNNKETEERDEIVRSSVFYGIKLSLFCFSYFPQIS